MDYFHFSFFNYVEFNIIEKASIEENCIRVIYELNDKYSFDNNENYSLNEDVFSKMINRAEKEITNDILKLIRG